MADMTIRATVIQLNSWLYKCNGGLGEVGEIQDVSCNPQQLDGDFWAVPQKDDGIFTQMDFIPYALFPGTVGPTYDSIRVFRISDKLNGYITWIQGTSDDYRQACAVCCGNAPYPMPTETWPIAPCQQVYCDPNDNYATIPAIFALPSLAVGQTIHAYGAYNNVPFTTASPAGYATPALLLTFLNASWATGPQGQTLVWSLSSDNMTLTATGGLVGDNICAIFQAIEPSLQSIP